MFKVRYFDELNPRELYEILKVRAEIFVVEQKCIYQDMDDTDYRSLHIFSQEDGKVSSYLRLFMKDESSATVQMGRVLTLEHGKGLGLKLIQEGVKKSFQEFKAKSIYIEAQCYATGFYEKVGFRVCSEEFMEDGIPHVQMILEEVDKYD